MSCDTTGFQLKGDGAITRGADWFLGVLPKNRATGEPIPVAGGNLSAQLFASSKGALLATVQVTMPTIAGDPIVCTLSASVTATLPVPQQFGTLWLKLLFTRADGKVIPFGSGPIQVNP